MTWSVILVLSCYEYPSCHGKDDEVRSRVMTSLSVECKSFGMMLATQCVAMMLNLWIPIRESSLMFNFLGINVIHLNFKEY